MVSSKNINVGVFCGSMEGSVENYFSYANEIASILRKNNINTEIYSDPNKNLGKQLTFSNKKGNPIACIIGDNEFKDQTITLKNLMAKKLDGSI